MAKVVRYTCTVSRAENRQGKLKCRDRLADILGMVLSTLLVLTLRTVALGALAFAALMVWRRKNAW